MLIGVPGETAANESRVALIPPVTKILVDRGHDVVLATGAGADAGWSDSQYAFVGCEVLETRREIFERADVVLQVRALGALPETPSDAYRSGQTVIGLLGPYNIDDETLEMLADRRINAFALELLPRIGRAQSMDVLTSMASVGGYKAVVTAADTLQSLFPMQMTAAGTVRPADVFVVGAGVAGLQAIATARRLGARVRAYDIRPAVKEEVESLGADFLELDLETSETTTNSGYASKQDPEFYREQRGAMTGAVGDADVVITSAAVPGKPAPTLVTTEMVDGMDSGSIIVDLAAEGGGNCELTDPGKTIERDGVTIIGPTNLPSEVSHTASQLFANNITNFLDTLLTDETLEIDMTDEIIAETLITHDGTIRTPHRTGETDAR